MRGLWGAVLLAVLAYPSSHTLAATRRVPEDYATIKMAVSSALDGDEVVVGPGTYTESIACGARAITLRSLDPSDPSVVAATVIRSLRYTPAVSFGPGGEGAVLAGFTLSPAPFFEGVGLVACDRSSPVIRDCTITGSSSCKDGIHCFGSCSPTILGNTVTGHRFHGISCSDGCTPTLRGNSVRNNGEGIFLIGPGFTVEDNTVSGNAGCGIEAHGPGAARANRITGNQGSGVWCYDGCMVQDNTITGNSSTETGGGIHCGDATITGNEIADNSAGFSGGGIFCGLGAIVTVRDNIIRRNHAEVQGGGVDCYGCSPFVVGNVITDNSAGVFGGGLNCRASASPTVKNSIFARNSAQDSGGGIACVPYTKPTVANCTFSANAAAQGGAIACLNHEYGYPGIGQEPPEATVDSCIIASSTGGGGVQADLLCAPTVSYSDLYSNAGGDAVGFTLAGPGIISRDPRFVDPSHDDFHLRSKAGRWDPSTASWVVDPVHSPCIDRGSPTAAYGEEPEPNGGRVNMGAYGDTAQASKSFLVADLDADGVVTPSDLAAFVEAWSRGDQRADLDGDGRIGATDAVEFLEYFLEACARASAP
jgi:parallel beta-helix repeat protein/predicted outer membrane repeat protein